MYILAILNRYEKYGLNVIGEYQCGFIKGKSTTDHIMEKKYKYNKNHLLFVDYKQAYDSINRNQLWIALEDFGIPKKLIKLTEICNLNLL